MSPGQKEYYSRNVVGVNGSTFNHPSNKTKFEVGAFDYVCVNDFTFSFILECTPTSHIVPTGFDSTTIYDPSGTQKEIVWIDEVNQKFYDPVNEVWIEYDTYIYDYQNFQYIFYDADGNEYTVSFNDTEVLFSSKIGDTVTNNYYYYYYNTTTDPENPDPTDPDPSDLTIIGWLEMIYEKLCDIFGSVEEIRLDDTDSNETVINNFTTKFDFLRSIKTVGDSFITDITTDAVAVDPVTGNAVAPVITADLSEIESHYGYDYGGEVVMLDLSWYAPYKPTVDALISGFLWLLFLWGLFKNAPGIISGMGITENRAVDVMAGWRGTLTSKSKIGR